MSKYLKLLVMLCFNIAVVEMGAFEWSFDTNISFQSGDGAVSQSGNGGMSLERWTTGQGRFWDEQYWRAGDFDGDGVDDLARVYRDGRNVSIDVYRSDKEGFVLENWGIQQSRFWDEQDWRVGDFDGDGVDDLARVFRDGRNVSIDVYRSSKKGFTLESQALRQGRFWDEQYWRAGDFDGDGIDDLARVFRDGRNVSIDVYRSSEKGFTLENRALQQGRFWDEQYWRAGDFDGDGMDDLARVFRDGRNVSIDVYRSGKKGFALENRALQQGRFRDEQYWRAGDFNGDGVDDLARVFRDGRNVSIDVYRSDKTGFKIENQVSQQGRFRSQQDWRSGDFNGDGVDDLARVFKDEREVSIDVYLSRN